MKKEAKWFHEYVVNPKVQLEVYLLKNCPYSQQLAILMKALPRVTKKWVNRDSKNFFLYKEMFQSPTYPIVVVSTNDQKYHIGGYTD